MPIETAKSIHDLPLAVIKSMVSLATSGFGVVVALAWNQVIQNAVTNFVDPYLGKSGSLVSLLVYAIIMTLLAVIVTMQLVGVQHKLEELQARVRGKRELDDSDSNTQVKAATIKPTSKSSSKK